jgi:hypothetical protein
MPVIAANPVAAPQTKPRLCPHCQEFVPAGFAVICVHGFREEPEGKQAYNLHLHPWSITASDQQIQSAMLTLYRQGGRA